MASRQEILDYEYRRCVLCEGLEDVELTYYCEGCDNCICHDCAQNQPKYMYVCEEDCDNCKEVKCHHIIFNECPICTSNSKYAEVDDIAINEQTYIEENW